MRARGHGAAGDILAGMHGLRELRVIDFSTGIAGPYATKLLADAWAEVIKIEPPGGDPLRRWSATGGDLQGADWALFQFLHPAKRNTGRHQKMPRGEDAFLARVEHGDFTAVPQLRFQRRRIDASHFDIRHDGDGNTAAVAGQI